MEKDIKYKLAVVQMDCVVGKIAPNLEKIEKFAQAASNRGVDLVVFPECATTGYFIADDLARLAEPSDGPTDLALGKIAAKAGVKKITSLMVEGDPAEVVLDLATKHKADMIVMGSRGLSDFKGLLLGSISHKVSAQAECTCITVK